MPRKIALINYRKCVPEDCRDGICNAIKGCSRKVIKQEEPYDLPFIDMDLCLGCFECLPYCHRKAIEKA